MPKLRAPKRGGKFKPVTKLKLKKHVGPSRYKK